MRRFLFALVVLAALLPTVARAEPPVPVVLIPGWHGEPAAFDRMIPALEAAGLTVLDFDSSRPGAQALAYAPTADGLGEIAYRRDAPFTQNWGNAGPTVDPLALPGTSPRIDVRLDMTEADPWGHQVVATAVFRDVMLSDDLDGMDYYEAVVPLSGGRRDVFRISLNGATSQR